MKATELPRTTNSKRARISVATALAVTISALPAAARADEALSFPAVGTIWPVNETALTGDCSDFLEPEVFQTLTSSTIASCLNPETVNDRNAEGSTALHLAAGYSDEANLVHHLLALGADMTLLDRKNREPIHIAAQIGNSSEIVVALSLAGADVDARMNQKRRWIDRVPGIDGAPGTTPLHLAAARSGRDDLVAALLLAGANPNIREQKKGQTALHQAANLTENRGVIHLLLQKGADPNIGDEKGVTPLMLAINTSPSSPIVSWMLSMKGDPDKAREDGITALMAMGQSADTEISFKTVLAASDKHCAVDDEGRSALHFAELNDDLKETKTRWDLHQECNADN